ncbi:MAG: molybdate ABC transporter substrate-binding protein [Actinomycetota bacterium]
MSSLRPLFLLLGVLLTSCGGSSDGDTVLVFAAASLTDAFQDMERAFEAANPDIDIVLNLAGSSTLREQILDGAPADLFASASPEVMDQVVDAGAVTGSTRPFAANRMQVAVPAGNPAGVEELADLADDDLLVGLCAPAVPCGALARAALMVAGVDAAIDTEEPDVRALLGKLEAGELDAGIVYASDVAAADGRVEGVGDPNDLGIVTDYPLAVLADAPNPDAAAAFAEFVLSEEGSAVLDEAGFVLP